MYLFEKIGVIIFVGIGSILVIREKRVHMQNSAIRLQKSKGLGLSRILGIGLVLASIGISIASLPEYWNNLQHQGVVQDVYFTPQSDGTGVVGNVSPEAIEKGIAAGDTLLNPEEDSYGEIGTPVTLQFQRGNEPARQVTFERKPADLGVYAGVMSGWSVQTSTTLSLLTALLPLILGSISALLICWLRSDNWMAVLTAMMLAAFGTATLPGITNPIVVIPRVLTLPIIFAWMLLFPNGKFAPRWSWMLILLILPTSVLTGLLDVGVVSWSNSVQGISTIATVLSYLSALGILIVTIYRYRRIFSPTERQQTKWVITALVLFLLLLLITGAIYNYYWNAGEMGKGLVAYLINSWAGTVGLNLLILSVLIATFRYRSILPDHDQVVPAEAT